MGLLTITASPMTIRLSSSVPPSWIDPTGESSSEEFSISIYVDGDGASTEGVSGDHLKIVGEVDLEGDGIVDYAGVLLTGEVRGFGYEDSGGPTDSFDFLFEVTGGVLASDPPSPYPLKSCIMVEVTSENSDFEGRFTTSFGGDAKGTLGDSVIDCAEGHNEQCPLSVEKNCLVTIPSSSGDDCEGKVIRMTLEYTGDSCDTMSNDQDPKKVNCKDYKELDGSEVRIVVGDMNGKKKFADGTAELGGKILVDAANAGRRHLKSTTHIKILKGKKLVQRIKFHTSCSQPLNVGDQFGSVKVVALETTKGGLAVLTDPPVPSQNCVVPFPGADVRYFYKITNNSAEEDIYITSVVDNKLDLDSSPIPSPLTRGATVELTADAFVSELTTNGGTVVGTVGAGGPTCQDVASSTVSVGDPPPTPHVCTTKIVAMQLKYIGPDIGNANVRLLGSRRPGANVVYSIDNLTTGTVLSDTGQNGWTIDATASGLRHLGSKTTISIKDANGLLVNKEVIHTSCSTPFVKGLPAPLDGNSPGHPQKGDPSPNWEVVGFIQK